MVKKSKLFVIFLTAMLLLTGCQQKGKTPIEDPMEVHVITSTTNKENPQIVEYAGITQNVLYDEVDITKAKMLYRKTEQFNIVDETAINAGNLYVISDLENDYIIYGGIAAETQAENAFTGQYVVLYNTLTGKYTFYEHQWYRQPEGCQDYYVTEYHLVDIDEDGLVELIAFDTVVNNNLDVYRSELTVCDVEYQIVLTDESLDSLIADCNFVCTAITGTNIYINVCDTNYLIKLPEQQDKIILNVNTTANSDKRLVYMDGKIFVVFGINVVDSNDNIENVRNLYLQVIKDANDIGYVLGNPQLVTVV